TTAPILSFSRDGDHPDLHSFPTRRSSDLAAVNPPPSDPLAHVHATIALLVAHHRAFGYRHFVVNHIWTSPGQLADLRGRLAETRSEEHTSELQSRENLVCRLLLEKKKKSK